MSDYISFISRDEHKKVVKSLNEDIENLKYNYREMCKKNAYHVQQLSNARSMYKELAEEYAKLRKQEECYKRFMRKRKRMIAYQHNLEAKIKRQHKEIKRLSGENRFFKKMLRRLVE
jgi:DNA repair exonuclease SbcCD ATPase subunit